MIDAMNMDPRLYEANGRRQGHALGHNGTDASGRQADGAEVGIHNSLVDDVAALPIFLIIHYERHRGGGCEESCIAGGREQIWPCQKRMLQIQNCTVQVERCPGGSVYSPTRKRK